MLHTRSITIHPEKTRPAKLKKCSRATVAIPVTLGISNHLLKRPCQPKQKKYKETTAGIADMVAETTPPTGKWATTTTA